MLFNHQFICEIVRDAFKAGKENNWSLQDVENLVMGQFRYIMEKEDKEMSEHFEKEQSE